MTGGRVNESQSNDKPIAEAPKTQTCDEWFAKFVMTPISRYIIFWNIIMTLFYLLAILMDTIIIGFHL